MSAAEEWMIEEEWVDDALCAQTDPELFYPEKGGSNEASKAVCMQCPVRTECLAYALKNDERFGIWGGLSYPQRRRIKTSDRKKTRSGVTGVSWHGRSRKWIASPKINGETHYLGRFATVKEAEVAIARRREMLEGGLAAEMRRSTDRVLKDVGVDW